MAWRCLEPLPSALGACARLCWCIPSWGNMANPEFRKGSARAAGGRSLSGRFQAPEAVAGSPFTQAQILHLMKTEFARGRRYGFPVSCILIQVDRLTQLVDLHGTQLRDVVRRELIRLVSTKTRGADQLGLVSDDRCLLVLPHADEEGAVRVGQRIGEAFSMLEVEVGGALLSLTLAIGVATSDEQQTMFFDTILSQAEAALGWAVDAGGNQTAVFRPQRVEQTPLEEDSPEPSGHTPLEE